MCSYARPVASSGVCELKFHGFQPTEVLFLVARGRRDHVFVGVVNLCMTLIWPNWRFFCYGWLVIWRTTVAVGCMRQFGVLQAMYSRIILNTSFIKRSYAYSKLCHFLSCTRRHKACCASLTFGIRQSLLLVSGVARIWRLGAHWVWRTDGACRGRAPELPRGSGGESPRSQIQSAVVIFILVTDRQTT